ncbi:LPS assembly lipoprotein LptE [Ramlibacter sp. AN1015]|uniref:LPS-assembly lipoprotein LptE n=1 Tax=Ramlibacter sp. AN1015 TaxID=3133428 RepID=UPI0030BA391B
MADRRKVLRAAALVPLGLVAGCGFQLRKAPDFAFASIYIAAPTGSPLANELRRNFASIDTVRLLAPEQPPASADVVLELGAEQRQKVVVGLTASGQVREFQLRSAVTFSLRTPAGRQLIAPTTLEQQRDVSFNESAVLAKEAEDNLLYRDMQSDLVQQLIRRVAAVKAA